MGMPILGREAQPQVEKPSVSTAVTGEMPAQTRVVSGRSLEGTDLRLTEIITAAANALPPGYTVRPTSGMRSSGQGQHTLGKAQDWQIFDPKGNPIVNRGDDETGLYTLLAKNAYGYQEKYHPELTGQFQWGGQFGTSGRNLYEPDLMHFDIGGRRGRISQYSRESIGAALPPEADGARVAVAAQPGFISGRATTFGYHDPDDPGVGSPKLGKINTNEGSLVGIAVPEEALRAQIGANPAAWRRARVEIVTSDGRHMLVPIVDLGPGDIQLTKGIAADFTHGLATVLKHSDQNNYQFRIIPNAGVDVMKNPQAFVAEQAQLAKGVDLSPKAKAPAAAMGGYVLVPESEAQKADSTQQVQAQAQAQQNVLSALHEHAPNMPSWYHALEKPIPGVTDVVRNATREEFKKQITAYAQDYYKESDPDKAFQRIMQAPNLLTSAGEIITKAPAHIQHALLAWSRGLDANGENRIIDFINKVHPEATPEARAGFVREILSKPAGNERTRFVSALYSSVDPQITQGIDLPALLDSIDTISQPGYQEKRKAEINTAVAKNLKDLRTDPTMENTWGGTVSDAIAQMPKNLGEALFPVIGQSAMTSEIYFDTLDGLRKEHPGWSEDQLKAKAGAASVPQVVLQEVVNLATMGLGGGLVKGITNPVARIAANSILHGGIAGTAATVQQGVANWATGRPITEGMPQAGIAGGIQGMIGGAMHVPEARPRGALEAATGPEGAPIRGSTERTLEETAPAPETPRSVEQNVPQRRVEPVPPPLPIEAHSDQNLEQRSIPPIRTPEEGERGMTEEEAHAYLDTLSNEIEQRHQARASDVGLMPREENPHATVHDVPPPSPPVPPERFSLGAQVPKKGLSVPEANKVVDTFREQFPHAPPIDVVGVRTELPAHLQTAIAQHAGDHSVEALIHDGRVRVVAGENVSPEQLHKALLEESIGHYGVEQVLGKKFDHLTGVVSKSMAGHPQYEALKTIYGHDSRTLAAEYIARAARGQIEAPSVWAHVKTWFNQLARRLGFKRAFSDSELRVLLSRARGRLEKGGGRSVVSLSPPRFRLTSEYPESKEGEIQIGKPTREELKGPGIMRSAYDALSRNRHTAPLAAALMHHIDRSHELLAKLNKPILEAFRGVKRKDLKQVLADVSKIQEARDNKRPIPTGLHPDAYRIVEAMKASAKMSADLAVQNKILVFDPRLNGGKGGYRAFHAVGDYVPRSVKRETIDLMRNRHMNAENRKAWTGKVHEYVNKGFVKAGPEAEAEVIDLIKGAANLDTHHIDKKLGNIEKARIHKLPSNDYEYSLSGMLDYNRRVSDRMAEIEAYGQRGEMFQKAVDRIEKSPIAGSEQANGLIGYVKKIRNQTLGVNERPSLGKAMAIGRSFATGADLSGWTGMLQDLIGSTTQVPMHMGLWNTTKGYLHGLTHLKQMQAHGEDLGVLHDDIASSVREIDQHYASGAWHDKLARAGQKFARLGLTVSGRAWQENFVRKLTLSAAKYGLRDAVVTIRANPMSRRAGEWAHYLQRRGVDVSKIVTENGQGPESDRFLRRTVGDIQASYDLIQQSPIQRTDGGKFFGQYLGWATNQTRNVAKEVLLPIGRALSGQGQKKIDITVNGKTYKVQDSAFKAVQRGLILAASGAAAVGATDELKEFLLGRINSHRDMKQLAADIASHPDKMETYLHVLSSIYNGVLQSGMLGSVGSLLQYVQDPMDRSRFKDPLHPTVLSKGDSLWGFIRRSVQEGQWNSHEADNLMKNWFGAYREGKPIAARIASTLGYSPDVVKEERTRESVAALRNTLKRFNDEQQLGIKPPPGQPLVGGPDASRTTPVTQSITDALYRGDSLAAKKLQEDYLKSIPDAATRQKAANSIRSSIQSSTPLRLGSTSNPEFQKAFWNWAREEGNVTPAQTADFRNLVNAYAKTAYAAGFGRAMSIVPEEKGAPKIVSKRAHTAATEILREMIRKENAAQALMAH